MTAPAWHARFPRIVGLAKALRRAALVELRVPDARWENASRRTCALMRALHRAQKVAKNRVWQSEGRVLQ